MRSSPLLLLLPLLALGCKPTIVGKISTDTGGVSTDDDDDDGDGDDTADGDDTGGGDGGDGGDDTGEDPDPEPEPDFSIWEGSRNFIIDSSWDDADCDEVVDEFGVEVTEDDRGYDDLADACPNCDHIYYIEVGSETACGYPLTQELYRGIVLGEGEAEVYLFEEDDGDIEITELDTSGDWDGWNLAYQYVFDLGWGSELEILGTVTFPELEER